MNQHNRIVSLLIRSAMAVLLGIGLALLLNTKSVAGDIKLDSIKTKTDLYENVTVTGHNQTDIFILHSQGMANVKIKDLDPETLWLVGLGEKPLEPGSPEAIAAAEAEANRGKMPAAFTKVLESASFPMAQHSEGEVQPGTDATSGAPFPFKPGTEQFNNLLPLFIGVAAITFAIYFFICYCLKLIVQKTGTEPGFMIWLPILQLIPMLRAAAMSMIWFLFWISPLLVVGAMGAAFLIFLRGSGNEQIMKLMPALSLAATIASVLQFITMLVWCVKIVKARGKSLWLALFLILPITNLFAFLYLAFSSSDSDAEREESSSQKIVIEPVFGDA